MGFGNDVEDFVIEFKNATEATMRGTTDKLVREIMQRTPVDEGRLRNNWQVSGPTPTTKILKGKDKTGEKANKRNTAKIYKMKNWQHFTIVNNLPYAEVVEFGLYPDPVKRGTWNKKEKKWEIRSKGGFSRQAPGGMLRVSVKMFKRLIKEEFKNNVLKEKVRKSKEISFRRNRSFITAPRIPRS